MQLMVQQGYTKVRTTEYESYTDPEAVEANSELVLKWLCGPSAGYRPCNPSFLLSRPNPRSLYDCLDPLTGTTGHFMPHGMLAEDIKH
ncbi:hypothetical protein STEG23_030139, partial [Scotinomys teguina]